MEKKQFAKKFEKRGNFEKKERKESHIGGQDWYFRSMDLAEQYEKSNNWKFLSIQEYEDNFRTAKAILKKLYAFSDNLKIGWNAIGVHSDTKDNVDITIIFGVYKSREGKLAIPLYNSVISGKNRFVGLSNVVYGVNTSEEIKYRRTYFKHFKSVIINAGEIIDETKLWEFYEKEEKIDGVKYFGNQKFTLIFMDKDYVDGKSSIVHKKSYKKDIRYEKPVKKFNNDRKGGYNKGFKKSYTPKSHATMINENYGK